jgi:thymidylate synthase
MQFNKQYHEILEKILLQPEELNERTGSIVKALPHQVISFPIKRHIEVIGSRQVYPKSAAAELAWTLMGDKNITWLQKHTKMWDKFTNENNEIDCAYGWRWQTAFGRNQLWKAIQALRNDSSDRQIFISAWDPSKDGLGNRWSKNVPCPVGFMLNVIGGKLNLSFFMRSSDIVVGLIYDSIFYELLLIAIANELNVQYGQFTIFLNHAHVYASHFDIAEQMLRNYKDYVITEIYKPDQFVPQDFLISGPIAEWGIAKILQEPDEYVEYIKNLTTRPKSSPRAMRVNPEVVL